MFADAFKLIEHGQAAAILDALNPLLDGAKFDPSMARILSHPLPFYNGHDLVEVTDYDVNPPRRVSCVLRQGTTTPIITLLDGTNGPIYQLNASAPIFLNEKTIIFYTKFFFSYVRGRFGRFLIVESTDEVDWREEPAPAGMKALGKMIHPVVLKSVDDKGVFYLNASIVFKDSLFESDIVVQENGEVSLSNQELLVEDIPVLDDSFQQ